jgi:hypothetical protein
VSPWARPQNAVIYSDFLAVATTSLAVDVGRVPQMGTNRAAFGCANTYGVGRPGVPWSHAGLLRRTTDRFVFATVCNSI